MRIISSDNQQVLRPQLVTAEELTDTYDAILLSVKADALPAAMNDLAPAVGPGTAIIPFLNGMAHLDALNDRFGADTVLGGVVKVVTLVDQDGDIRQLAPLASMVIGEQSGIRTQRIATLEKDFGSVGFDFGVSDRIVRDMWHKWVFIATVTAITSLMRGSVGEIAAVPGGTEFAKATLAEAAAVASTAGFPLTDAEFAANCVLVTQEGSPYVPSMYRDLSSGLPTEVEHIFGDLLARADKLTVDVPRLALATGNLRVHQNRIAHASER